MSMKLEQAARKALEALEMIATYSEEDKQCDNGYGAAWVANTSITALREVLAEQAEQEPVATVVDESEEQTNTMSWILSLPLPVGTKLYAAPVRTKDLTDDEIEDLYFEGFNPDNMSLAHGFARAVIAADREKNK